MFDDIFLSYPISLQLSRLFSKKVLAKKIDRLGLRIIGIRMTII